jgi:hypothetical protein
VDDPYCYTNFIHLVEIIDSNWAVFQPVFERWLFKDKKVLMSWLRHLNSLRNSIMHPVKRKTLDAQQLQALRVVAGYFDLLGKAASVAVQPRGSAGISSRANLAPEGGGVRG